MNAADRTARYSTDVVVIDLEASSPVKDVVDVGASNIIEIGAVKLDGRSLQVKNTFSELVCPTDVPIQPFITEITGITPAMVAGRDDFAAVGQRFIDWYGPRNRSVLAAFGAYYDLTLLRKEFEMHGFRYREHFVGGGLDVRTVALVWLATERRNTTSVSIEGTLEKMGVAGNGFQFHRALDDARATAAILQHFHLGRVQV